MIKLFYIKIILLFLTLISAVEPIYAQDNSYEKEILHYINAYRTQHHLTPLQLNSSISKEAARHSQALANRDVSFGHTGFNGRIKRLYKKISNCHGGAENIAYYKLDAKHLVAAWLASPGHRRNIKGHYNLTGIGIAHDKKKGWAYFTQIFILRA